MTNINDHLSFKNSYSDNSTKLFKIIYYILFALLLLFANSAALANKSLNWSIEKIKLDVPSGGTKVVDLKLTANEAVSDISLKISKPLSHFVKISPKHIPSLDKNESIDINLTIDFSKVGFHKKISGKLKVKGSKKNICKNAHQNSINIESSTKECNGHKKSRKRQRLVKPLKIKLKSIEAFSVFGHVIPAQQGIQVWAFGENHEQMALTDSVGGFSLNGLVPGNYVIAPREIGNTFTPISKDITIEDCDIQDLIFVKDESPIEGLTPEDIEIIDNLPKEFTPADEIILPNGKSLEEYLIERGISPTEEEILEDADNEPTLLNQDLDVTSRVLSDQFISRSLPSASGPQERKNDVIAKMLAEARYYACGKRPSNRCTNWDFPADTSDPENKPSQNGLNYVFGSKSVTSRNKPVDSCQERTVGFDCSGLLHKVASAAGITIPVGPANRQGDPSEWDFPSDWDLKIIEVTDGSKESGDILVWDGHIGIAEDSNRFISALGLPNDCERNIGPDRGPISISISGFGRPVEKRLRIVSTLSGEFDMPIRCIGVPQVVGTIRFQIDNENGGEFTSNGSGTDLNGLPLCFDLNGNYDISRNRLSGELALCDNSRIDSFNIRLLNDGVDWFPLQKVVDNGGCPGEARFIRINNSNLRSLSSGTPQTQSIQDKSTNIIPFGGLVK